MAPRTTSASDSRHPEESRRSDLRLQVLGQLYGHVVPFDVPLSVQNISAGGFAVDSPIPFYSGTSHRFCFTTNQGRSILVHARTAHCLRVRTPEGDTRYLAGFEFICEPDDERAHESVAALLDAALSALTFH
jgi:hypothetical protein